MRLKHYAEIIAVIVILVSIGMSQTIVPQLFAPKDRVFAGFHGYSPDFVGYVSYIKQGMYGHYSMSFRSFPPEQPASPIHFEYIAAGMLFGPLGLEAPVIYHLLRVILGSLLIFMTYRLYLALFRNHHTAILTTLLAYVTSAVSWVVRSADGWRLIGINYFPFSVSVAQRATDRPHYLLGGIIFLWIFTAIVNRRVKKPPYIAIAIASSLLMIVHVASGLILALITLFLMLWSQTGKDSAEHKRQDLILSLTILSGSAAAAFISWYFVQVYSKVSDIFLDKYIYAVPMTFWPFFKEVVSFGPTFWIGIPALIAGALVMRTGHRDERLLLCAWALIQFSLFFVFYRAFRVDPIRFTQSLYYIPIAYGTVWGLHELAKRWGRWLFMTGIALVLLLTIPTYVSNAFADLHAMTDYQSFSPFGFPTKGQYDAYKYLDQHTPIESTVLGDYEAANMILLYSHNRVIGNDQGWTPEGGAMMRADERLFYSGRLTPSDALAYLKKNAISYVYDGYTERYYGGNLSLYPFLTKVYENPEVTIYRVKITEVF